MSTVCTPWPISVQEWNSVTEPSVSGRSTTLPYSARPLPTPVFLTAQAMPANGAAR